MDNRRIIKLLICLLTMALIFSGCGVGKTYYSLEYDDADVESTDTETTENKEPVEEPLSERYGDDIYGSNYSTSYGGDIYHYDFYENSFADGYTTAICAAINNGDFTMVEPYLRRNSALYNTQKARVEKMFSEGRKEYVLSYQVKNVTWPTPNKGYMVLYEKVDTVDAKGKSEVVEVAYKYVVEYIDGRYVLSDRTVEPVK